nr:unnamed protein product [Callosobruchus analis]
MASNKCSACKLDLGSDDKLIVACDSCRSRLHVAERCLGLSTSEASAVVFQKRNLMHFCQDCQDTFKSVPVMVRKIIQMEGEILTLKNKIETLEKQKASDADSLMYEVNQRTTRAQNLMIYNIPECNSTNLNERIAYARSKVSEVFTILGLQQELASAKKIVRVGQIKDASKARPVKVICNVENVKLALRSGRKLRESMYKLSYDQTPRQQEAYKKAKEALEAKKAAGEENLIIRYRNGVPKVKQQKNAEEPH